MELSKTPMGKCKITIRDQHTVDGETSYTIMTVFGVLDPSESGYTLRYIEQSGELEGYTTDVIYEEEAGIVSIRRRGSTALEMTLEEGKRHNCVYDLEEGRLIMGVDTHRIDSSMSRFGGTLKLNYDIDFNAGFVSENNLQITVKEIF